MGRTMGKARRIRRGAVVWQQLVSRQRSSGLTVPSFCRRERMNAALFYRWRARLTRQEGDPQPQSDTRQAVAPAPFIDLGALGSGGSRCEVRVDFGGGVVLTLARG